MLIFIFQTRISVCTSEEIMKIIAGMVQLLIFIFQTRISVCAREEIHENGTRMVQTFLSAFTGTFLHYF